MEIGTAFEIAEFLEVYDNHFKELRMFLLTKQNKVTGDDLVWLLESLNEEQRLIMRGNSLEAKRIALFEKHGLKDYKSAMLIDESPDEYKGKLKLLLDSISGSVDFIKETNEDVLDLIEKKLEVQAELLNETKITGSDTYNNTGAKIHRPSGGIDGDIIGSV